MAAVIQRVITSPVRTEYLSSLAPVVWGNRESAFIFKTHGLADALAVKMREAVWAARHETGQLGICFIHARTIENYERDEFVAKASEPEIKVTLDPKRMAEVLRDPAECYQ